MTPPPNPPQPEPTAKQLQAALRDALNTPPATRVDADGYAEDLFLIAAGRGDELIPARRGQLLDAVAMDPGVAALLQDAHALAGDAAETTVETTDESTVHRPSDAAGFAPTLHRSADDAPTLPPPPTSRFPRTAIKAVFALAACLTVALGVWRFADPPATQVAGDPHDLFNQPGLVVPSGVEDPPAAGGTGAAPTLAAATSPRDSALIASVALTAVLGLALVLLTPGGKPDDAG